jgi:hypothetical protein
MLGGPPRRKISADRRSRGYKAGIGVRIGRCVLLPLRPLSIDLGSEGSWSAADHLRFCESRSSTPRSLISSIHVVASRIHLYQGQMNNTFSLRWLHL